MANPNVLQVSEASFKTDVLDSSQPVLVDFWAEWCAPCRALAPTIDELANEFQGKAKIAKVDIEANPSIASQFGIRSIPTVLVFKNGQLVEQLVGRQSKTSYAEVLNKQI